MSRYNTNVPVPSSDMRNVWDNAQVQDEILNSPETTTTDRLGNERPTWTGIEVGINSIITSLDSAGVITVPDAATGLAATTNGQYFRVIIGSGSSTAFRYYRNLASAAVEITSLASKAYVDAGYKSTGMLSKELGGGDTILNEVAKNNQYAATTMSGWAVGVTSTGRTLNYIEMWLSNLSVLKTIRLDVYRRETDGAAVLPGAASDTLLQTISFTPSDIGVSDALVQGFQLARMPFSDITLPDGAIAFFVVQAFDASGTAVYVGSARQDITQAEASGLVNSLGGFYKSLSGGAWQPIAGTTTNPFRLAYRIGYNSPVKKDAGMISTRRDVSSRAPNSTSFALGAAANARWYAWAVGFPGITDAFDLITLYHSNLPSISSIYYRIILRANADLPGTNSPGVAAGDRHVFSGRVTPPSAASAAEFTAVEYPVPGLVVPSGYFAMIEVHAYDASGATVDIGTQARDYAAAGETAPVSNAKGYFVNRLNNAWASMGASLGLAWKLSVAGYIPVKDKVQQVAALSAENATKIASISAAASTLTLTRYYPTLTVTGRQVAIGGSAVVNGVTKALAATLTLAITTVGTKTVTTVLKQASSSTVQWPSNGNEWLGEKRISAVTVTDTATSTPLTAGTHYNVDGYGGKLRGLTATQYNASVAFTYTRERYDLIQIDPHTLVMSVVKGTERAFDVQEYRPVPAAGQVALYYVLVAGDVLEFEPVYRYPETGYEILDNGDAAVMRQHNRRCLQKTLARMARGQAITLLGYGDSITAVSNISNPLTTPGGTSRDRQLFLQGGYGTDTLSNLYPSENWNDGGGTIHIKIGWNWKLKAHLEDAWGCTVTYVNFGVSGSNSASGATAERLNAAVAVTPNLAVVCFGMNDNAVATTYASMMTIISTLKAAGADVVVVPVPRTSVTEDGRYSLEQWRYTNRQVYRAAIDAGAAYVPTDWLADEMSRGGMGVVTTSLCGADLRNHPGGYEMSVYGKALVNVFC